MNKARLYLYCSHALSAWGDRMWQFAVGLFLVDLSPGSLRLTASYGFATGGTILLLGAVVGNWVDNNPRLKVARTSIVIQNISLCFSAAITSLVVIYQPAMPAIWGGLESLCLVAIITFAVIADLSSVARQISIEKDWIVVICPDHVDLTAMSARLRRIDLCANILAPIATGQIISLTSTAIGAMVIAVWNLVSLVFEYGLLHLIYKSIPALAHKGTTCKGSEEADEESRFLAPSSTPKKNYGYVRYTSVPQLERPGDDPQNVHVTSAKARLRSQKSCNVPPTRCFARSASNYGDLMRSRSVMNFYADTDGSPDPPSEPHRWYSGLVQPFHTLYMGWKVYMAQDIMLAGLSLGLLYLTALGFDNVTVGFAKEQGVSEGLIGILLASGALMGIGGTLIYPVLRNRFGLAKTGVFAYALDIICLIPCVLSIFAPGSPFQPLFLSDMKNAEINDVSIGYTSFDDSTVTAMYNTTIVNDVSDSYMSVGLLMAGIVVSRTALWMADLTVTQLLLERPLDNQRGLVNGVQNSINKLTDIIKFVLVIFLPWPEIFGYLIIVSYAAILAAAALFTVYGCRHWGKDVPGKAETDQQTIVVDN